MSQDHGANTTNVLLRARGQVVEQGVPAAHTTAQTSGVNPLRHGMATMSVESTRLSDSAYERAMAEDKRVLDTRPETDHRGLHSDTLSAAELAHFHAHGFVVLGHVAPPEFVDALCTRMDDLMMGRVRTAQPMLFQLCPSATDLPQFIQYGSTQTKVWKGPTLRYRKIQDLEQDLLYRDYMALPVFQDLASKIIGPSVSIYRSMLFNKPAGSERDGRRQGGVPIYWCAMVILQLHRAGTTKPTCGPLRHQDGNPAPDNGWGLDIDPKITVWTALDDCTVRVFAPIPPLR